MHFVVPRIPHPQSHPLVPPRSKADPFVEPEDRGAAHAHAKLHLRHPGPAWGTSNARTTASPRPRPRHSGATNTPRIYAICRRFARGSRLVVATATSASAVPGTLASMGLRIPSTAASGLRSVCSSCSGSSPQSSSGLDENDHGESSSIRRRITKYSGMSATPRHSGFMAQAIHRSTGSQRSSVVRESPVLDPLRAAPFPPCRHRAASEFDDVPVGPPPEFRPADLDPFRSAPDLVDRPRDDDVPDESEFWNRSAPVPAGFRFVSLRRISAGRDLPSERVMAISFGPDLRPV